jgi:hypothetical protein
MHFVMPRDGVLLERSNKRARELLASNQDYVRVTFTHDNGGVKAGFSPLCGRTLLRLIGMNPPTPDLFTQHVFLGSRCSPNGSSWLVIVVGRDNNDLPYGLRALVIPTPSLLLGLQKPVWQTAAPLTLQWSHRIRFVPGVAARGDASRIIFNFSYQSHEDGGLAPLHLDAYVTDDGQLKWQSDISALPELSLESARLPNPVLIPSD